MTEKEIQELTADVLNGDEVPVEFEIQHLRAVLENLHLEKNRIMVNFRMWSYVRDDERLNQSRKDVKRVRDCIEFVEKRLSQLAASVA